ncbi:MAG: hypothetical protein M3460_16685 [Actinomycetota bacterium]|nr:hypothetical protein [Actinomycetota bacterium]
MTADYTFLPWSRRGLAARTNPVTDLATALPARAKVTVGLTVSNIPESPYDLTLYGPGDVVGIDPKLIVRIDPRPNSIDVEPNYFPLIEFDAPDFPWMFTPAASGPDDRLRPWCVLIAVDLSVVDPPRVEPGRPLPVLVVPRSVAPVELPNLFESWAWAHTQVIVSPNSGSIATELADRPAMNVSRLLAPRRLESGKRYAACLVPAFDSGVTRGLGDTPADDTTLRAAWTMVSGDVKLPVYFHWEFTTGPVGGFEELARGLQPFQVPGTAGGERMYIGAAGPDLPAIPPTDPAAYLTMDGALRPRQGSPGTLAEVPLDVQQRLRAALDAAAVQATSRATPGPTPTTSGLGPPIYGAWHARQHTVAADVPVWLRELNLDPRTRAAAGLGAQIVRENQEQFMQWCWEQVEQILEANRLLSQARLSLDALSRVHARHFATLPEDRLLQLTAPLHSRTKHADVTIAATIAGSSLPNAAADPALRRLTSPVRPVLRAAIARATPSPTLAASAPRVRLVSRLASGGIEVDPTRFVPHGLLGIPAINSVPPVWDTRETNDLTVIGLPLSVPALGLYSFARKVSAATAAALADPNPRLVGLDLQLAWSTACGEEALRRARSTIRDPTIPTPWRTLTEHLSWIPNTMDRESERRLEYAVGRVLASGLVIPDPPPPVVPMAMGRVRDSLRARTNPRVTVPSRLGTMLAVGGQGLVTDPPAGLTLAPALDRVMAAPEIDVAVYGYLARLDPARFLPGVGEISENTITVLETNPRFVEALLVGVNHEMNRELLWRAFPTDQRGTPFRRFWDRSDGAPDIGPIHTWAGNELGTNGPSGPAGQQGQIALLIRGQLLRRYPNTSIYAWRARNGVLVDPPNAPDDIRRPVFAGGLGPDTVFVGFELTDVDLRQGDGWFFVLQEQPTEPRFGFDEFKGTGTPPELHSWSDATWQHTATAPGRYLRVMDNPLTGLKLGNATFVDHAAHLAAITLQQPVRVAFHAGGLPQVGTL